ncbi:MAG: glutamate--tRNA ligase family protein, partial [Schleiferiaceae bacterium]|nr:glutamate--tRNA ligase family protein [Schleiferiaceae bacterium]
MQGRLAPSPSGHLHIGNASSLLLAWLDARSSGSALMMRMDDLDPQRSKMAFAEAALTDLSWMGL